MDAVDFVWLSQWCWSLKDGYAVRASPNDLVPMHRQILGLRPGDKRQGDHENRDRLDNRRSNLRIAMRGDRDNQQNVGLRADSTSGYRGVVRHKESGRWQAQATLDGRYRYLGRFDTPEEADVAAKAFRAEHMPFSEDARLAA